MGYLDDDFGVDEDYDVDSYDENSESPDYNSIFRRKRTAALMAGGPASEGYRKLLNTPSPSESVELDRTEYKPSIGNKILSAITGLTEGIKSPGRGIAAALEMSQRPIREQEALRDRENARRMAQARIGDAAFGRKLNASRYDMADEERRNYAQLLDEQKAEAEAGRNARSKATVEDREKGREETRKSREKTYNLNRERLAEETRHHKEMEGKEKPDREKKEIEDSRFEAMDDLAVNPFSRKYFTVGENGKTILRPDLTEEQFSEAQRLIDAYARDRRSKLRKVK